LLENICRGSDFIALYLIEDVPNIFYQLQSRQYITHSKLLTNLLNYFLMVSNARVKFFLQDTLRIFMNLFIFLHVLRRDMMLSDIQYGCLQLLELSTGHCYQNGIQTEQTENCTQPM
jgi:hypothetical protein